MTANLREATENSILVLGAGELGMAVLRGLARRSAQPARITVLLRCSTIASSEPENRKKIDELRSLGVTFLGSDLAILSAAQLSGQFCNFGTIIGCTGFVGGAGTQIKLARAVVEAGVKRYVPWQFGVDYDVIGRHSPQELFDEQLDVRDLLRSQKHTKWVIISTGMFTSFLFDPQFGVVDLAQNTVHALGSWTTAVTVTAAEDIGSLTAELVLTEPEIVNRVVYTAGDTVTYGRLADIVDASLKRKLNRVAWPVSLLRRELSKDPNDMVKKYRAVFAAGRGVAWDKATTYNEQRGIHVEDIESWVRRNLVEL
jgi:hypothetical protein